MSYVVCYRRPDGFVETDERPTLPSAIGVLAHLTNDYAEIWVRENPGGAIVLAYDRDGDLRRP